MGVNIPGKEVRGEKMTGAAQCRILIQKLFQRKVFLSTEGSNMGTICTKGMCTM